MQKEKLVKENKLMINNKHEKTKFTRSFPVKIQIYLNK